MNPVPSDGLRIDPCPVDFEGPVGFEPTLVPPEVRAGYELAAWHPVPIDPPPAVTETELADMFLARIRALKSPSGARVEPMVN